MHVEHSPGQHYKTDHKTSINKFTGTEIIQSMISHNRVKLDINNRIRKIHSYVVINKIWNNQWVKELKRKMRKYETNKNENTKYQSYPIQLKQCLERYL